MGKGGGASDLSWYWWVSLVAFRYITNLSAFSQSPPVRHSPLIAPISSAAHRPQYSLSSAHSAGGRPSVRRSPSALLNITSRPGPIKLNRRRPRRWEWLAAATGGVVPVGGTGGANGRLWGPGRARGGGCRLMQDKYKLKQTAQFKAEVVIEAYL